MAGDRFSEPFMAFMGMAPAERRAAWRRNRNLQWLAVAVAWFWLSLMLVLLKPVAFSSPFERYQFSPPNLGTAMFDVFIVILLPLITILFTAFALPSPACWYGAAIVRAAALAGKNTLAVGAIEQPKPLTGDEIPQDSKPFAALKLPRMDRMSRVLVMTDIILTLTFIAAALFLWPRAIAAGVAAGRPKDNPDFAMFVLPFVSTGKVFALYGIPRIVADGWWILLPGRKRTLLAVDDWGIRWRERRWRTRDYTLAWQDITAFCVYRHLSELSLLSGFTVNTTYMLLSDGQSFAWVARSRGKGKDAERAASELFARMVSAHTRCPLLDVTASISTASALSSSFGRAAKASIGRHEPGKTLLAELEAAQRLARVSRHEMPGMPGALSDLAMVENLAGFGGSLAGSVMRPLRLKARFYWINAALIALVAVGVCGGWMVDQQRADAYYRTLSGRVIAETPVYRDALASDTHAWPTHTPTSADKSNLAYANGGYTINGGLGQSNYNVWQGARYADLAVAVTLRELAAPDYDTAGLAARVQGDGRGDDDAIIFDISPGGGDWELFHYQPGQSSPDDGWHYLNSGESAAINTDSGVANRLLLVVIGTNYLCYINGQFVGGAVDPYGSSAPTRAGYAGLFVRAPTTTAVFNDFALYPAPPPYQPLIHGW